MPVKAFTLLLYSEVKRYVITRDTMEEVARLPPSANATRTHIITQFTRLLKVTSWSQTAFTRHCITFAIYRRHLNFSRTNIMTRCVGVHRTVTLVARITTVSAIVRRFRIASALIWLAVASVVTRNITWQRFLVIVYANNRINPFLKVTRTWDCFKFSKSTVNQITQNPRVNHYVWNCLPSLCKGVHQPKLCLHHLLDVRSLASASLGTGAEKVSCTYFWSVQFSHKLN